MPAEISSGIFLLQIIIKKFIFYSILGGKKDDARFYRTEKTLSESLK